VTEQVIPTGEGNPFSSEDEHWMRYAINLASKGEAVGEVPVGAVIVSDNKLIGEGWNQPISSYDPTAHAEIVALRQAATNVQNYRLIGATLYVTLEPCTMCVGALVHSRIERLVYGTTEPKAGAVVSQTQILDSEYFNHKVTYSGGLLATECQHQLSRFFQWRREQKKQQKIQDKPDVNDE
jgi:tRNA(adenine34) deaminase